MDTRTLDIMNQPIFIIGVPRSGTTWVQRILMAHPEVCSGQESKFFSTFGPALRYFFHTKQSQRQAGLYWYWSEEDFKQELTQLWYKTMSAIVKASPQASLLVEKTPDHCICIPEILQLLPHSRFIHVIRDSRSVVASLLAASQAEWGAHWAPKTAKDAALYWVKRVSKAQEDSQQLSPEQYIEIFYEDLKAKPNDCARKIFQFSKLAISDTELEQTLQTEEFSKVKKDKSELQDSSVYKPLEHEPKGFFRKGEVDSWKQDLSLRQQLIVWRYTRKKMRQCGYSWQGKS